MKESRSAGVVIFRENQSHYEFLLLLYPAGHWDFVKGGFEKNESPHQTADRETKEETGISDLEFVNNFDEKIEYFFQHDGKLIHKEVFFFLAKTKTIQVTLSHEHIDFVWLDFENAMKKITYKNAQRVLTKANDLLSK